MAKWVSTKVFFILYGKGKKTIVGSLCGINCVDIGEGGVEFNRKYDLLFSGLMSTGTQGCSFQTMLVLNGDARGRVVSIDKDLEMPRVAPQKNFLAWYDSWLAKV